MLRSRKQNKLACDAELITSDVLKEREAEEKNLTINAHH